MDPERERIRADLRGVIDCEVLCDDLSLQMYATDASIFEVKPLAAVRPRRAQEVVACVRYAYENQIPIHARGAGSGLAGESLGGGVILDFAHALRRVVEYGEQTVRVQPGVSLAQLNRQLAESGRIFGPDPANRAIATMGGVISVDASGSHWLLHGSARDHVESLQVILANGDLVQFAPETVEQALQGESERARICAGLVEILQRNKALIDKHASSAVVNCAGYQLSGVLEEGKLDVAKLLVGAEGTLGLITEATLRTAPRVKHRGLVLLFFEKLDLAAKAALEIPRLGASACDLLDRRVLAIARETDRRYFNVIPTEAEAMLLVEMPGETASEVQDRLNQAVDRIRRRRRWAFHAIVTTSPEEVGVYWELARRIAPILYRLKGTTRPLPYLEDLAIPPNRLPEFLTTAQNVLKKHQVTASLFAHAGQGQLHIRPLLNLADKEDIARLGRVASDLYDEVWAIGGTISGQNGDGLSRTPYLERQFGPLYAVFQEIKRLFDPRGIFNPGKKIATEIRPLETLIRPLAAARQNESGETQPARRGVRDEDLTLAWTTEEMGAAVRACNGCARCRTHGADERMCPIFRFEPKEEASPRAKANLLRGVLTGHIAPEEMATEPFRRIVDLCVNCHQCRIECPATVDIPKMVTEIKSQYYETNGLSFRDSVLARIDRWAAWGHFFRPLANWAIRNQAARWLIEKLFGIAQGRKLPQFARRSFLRLAQRRRLSRPTRRSGRKVLFFVDMYANLFDPQLAEALVSILEHNGVAVYVHPGQTASGMPAISLGATPPAKKMAQQNLRTLAEAVRQGYEIVATEPSAVMCLKHEYRQLLGSEEADLVAAGTTEACHYIWGLHQSGELNLDFRPLHVSVGFHTPCHVRALYGESAGAKLLKLVPGLQLRSIEKGCSGMAGAFGLSKKNFRSSLRAGWDMISALRDPQIQIGSSECSACKMQMEQGTAKSTVHPLKLLAASYGLGPGIDQLVARAPHELTIS
ncbi:MAG: anaerobic glycerol-3-phosphate dehydrogenase subunit C [Blastopirellula sp. JB062]